MKLKRIFQYEARSPGEARVNKYDISGRRPHPRRKRKRDELREEFGLDNTYDRRRRKPILLLCRPTNFSPSPFSDEGTATMLELHVSWTMNKSKAILALTMEDYNYSDVSKWDTKKFGARDLTEWRKNFVGGFDRSVVLVPPKKEPKAKSNKSQKKVSYSLKRSPSWLAGWLADSLSLSSKIQQRANL